MTLSSLLAHMHVVAEFPWLHVHQARLDAHEARLAEQQREHAAAMVALATVQAQLAALGIKAMTCASACSTGSLHGNWLSALFPAPACKLTACHPRICRPRVMERHIAFQLHAKS